MKKFEVEEHASDEGITLVLKALNGFEFDNGGNVMEIKLIPSGLPRKGERVMCGGRLIKVKDVKFNSEGSPMLFDEDMEEWCLWQS